jgi:aminocarboxymuconate-semialdehyde decarboxylase
MTVSVAGGWDVHAHIVPPAIVAAGENGLYGMAVAQPSTLRICAHGVPLVPLSQINAMIERIKLDALDGAVVSIPPPLFRPDLNDSDRESYVKLVNDSLLAACHPHRATLRPFAYLPAEAPELAARIAQTLDYDWAGAVVGTETGGLSYASERYDPLWQTLSATGLPLFIHPGSSPDRRLDPFYLSNLLGNPLETTVAAANLVFGGVLHRFPNLKIILAHGGGCVAALCGRWQRGFQTARPGILTDVLSPAASIRRLYVDSIVHSPAFLRTIIETIGEDHVLLGSDWPFPMGAPNAEHDLADLDPAIRAAIRKTNAENVFGARLGGSVTCERSSKRILPP